MRSSPIQTPAEPGIEMDAGAISCSDIGEAVNLEPHAVIIKSDPIRRRSPKGNEVIHQINIMLAFEGRDRHGSFNPQ